MEGAIAMAIAPSVVTPSLAAAMQFEAEQGSSATQHQSPRAGLGNVTACRNLVPWKLVAQKSPRPSGRVVLGS